VEAGLKQVRRIPGVAAQAVDIRKCNNPTFSASGENTLAKNAPQPQPCDKKGPTQCVGARSTGAGTSTTGGGTGGASGGGTTGTTGTTGAVTTGGTTGSGVAGAPVLGGPSTTGATTVDPDTGAVVAGPDEVAGGAVSAVPVAIGAGGVGSPKGLVLLAIALLVGVTVVPPLLDGRLRRGAGS
jgi:hypothetical protein